MSRIVACITLVLMVASISVPVGIGYAKSSPNLAATTGLLKVWNSWSINPCKYTYNHPENNARVSTTISNFSEQEATFDLGDGSAATVPANSSIEHNYYLNLKKQTVKIAITKLGNGTGMRFREALMLKIEPRKKGE